MSNVVGVVEVLLVLDNQPYFFLNQRQVLSFGCFAGLPLTSKTVNQDKALEDGAEAAALCRHWV